MILSVQQTKIVDNDMMPYYRCWAMTEDEGEVGYP